MGARSARHEIVVVNASPKCSRSVTGLPKLARSQQGKRSMPISAGQQQRDEIRRIQQAVGTTTVFVTHDQRFAHSQAQDG
jgi:ABC-type sugar transport system ATPase subunit